MATLPDVTKTDLTDLYEGDVTDFADTYLNGKLNEVVDEINLRWGSTVERRLASGALPLRHYKAVVVRVAARVLRNTDGFRKENEGQYGYELNPLVASGALWFTADDEYALTGVNPKGGTRLPGTINVGIAPPGGGWVR